MRIAAVLLALLLLFAFPVPASAMDYPDAAMPAAQDYALPYEAVDPGGVSDPDSIEDVRMAADSLYAVPIAGAGFVAARIVAKGAPYASSAAAPVSAAILATHVNANVDLDTLIGGIVDIIIKMASYVGMVLVIGGIFQLILAYKDDNADSQSRAIRNIVVGASLMGLRIFLVMAGIIV